jgi:hypothetical protein
LLRGQFQVERLGRLALDAERLDPVHAQLFVDGVTDSLLAWLLFHHGITPDGAPQGVQAR